MTDVISDAVSGYESLKGKRVLVVGSGHGVGQAAAEIFASAGAKVAGLDINLDGAKNVAEAINARGGSAEAFHCDLADPESIETAVADAAQWAGGLDCLAVVAAVAHVGAIEDLLPEDFHRVLNINVVGPFVAAKAALPYLRESRGSIVNVASVVGIKGMPFGTPYAASKAGMIQFSKSLAVELWESGVRVNVVAPGGIKTGMPNAGDYPEGGFERVLARSRTPFGPASAAEVAHAVVFLATDAAAKITGVVLPVDGGASA